MKKIFSMGVITGCAVLILISMAYPQADKEILLKKEAQAEIPADSDSYVIGSEDVLYIHVWKEEDPIQNSYREDGWKDLHASC